MLRRKSSKCSVSMVQKDSLMKANLLQVDRQDKPAYLREELNVVVMQNDLMATLGMKIADVGMEMLLEAFLFAV